MRNSRIISASWVCSIDCMELTKPGKQKSGNNRGNNFFPDLTQKISQYSSSFFHYSNHPFLFPFSRGSFNTTNREEEKESNRRFFREIQFMIWIISTIVIRDICIIFIYLKSNIDADGILGFFCLNYRYTSEKKRRIEIAYQECVCLNGERNDERSAAQERKVNQLR